MPFQIVKHFLLDALQTFFPMDCPVCGNPSMDGVPGTLCAECLSQIAFVHPPYCPGCGGELTGIMEMCPACLKAETMRPWEKAFSIYRMNGFGRELVHRYKYRNQPELARALGHLAMVHSGELLRAGNFDFIVPAPLHWFRYMQRGYNQSELLAQMIGKEIQVPVLNALRRVKWTHQQAHLSQKERILNLKSAFCVKRMTNIKNRAILLTDDVLTTGATLAEASNALLEAGASRVCVLVIARR